MPASRVVSRVRRGDDSVSKASEYRRLAAECLEIANGLSAGGDRARITQMAQKWLELADRKSVV